MKEMQFSDLFEKNYKDKVNETVETVQGNIKKSILKLGNSQGKLTPTQYKS